MDTIDALPTKIQIISMRLMRNQVENVRAMFMVDIGPIRLVDCYLMGKIYASPESFTVAMPGRRSRDGQTWKTLAILAPDVETLLQQKAQDEYLRLVEPAISKNSIKMPAHLYQLELAQADHL